MLSVGQTIAQSIQLFEHRIQLQLILNIKRDTTLPPMGHTGSLITLWSLRTILKTIQLVSRETLQIGWTCRGKSLSVLAICRSLYIRHFIILLVKLHFNSKPLTALQFKATNDTLRAHPIFGWKWKPRKMETKSTTLKVCHVFSSMWQLCAFSLGYL